MIAGKVWRDDFSRYEAIIRGQGLEERVLRRIRYIPDEEAPLYYRAADLVVLPYRRIYQSGVLLMAMSYGVPVLASDLPGMVEIVTDGETGYVFRSENPEHLALRVQAILGSPDRHQAVGEAGREFVDPEHDGRRIGRLTRAVYENAEVAV